MLPDPRSEDAGMFGPTRRFIRAGGHRTCLIEAGDPAQPTVVLVHDGAHGTDAALCWGPIIEDLAGDHHVLAPDLIGWGGTDKLCYFDRSPYDFRLEHLAAMCSVLGLDEPVYFAGSSFGAELVVRGTAVPSWGWKVRAAVAITGTGGRLFRVPGGIEQLGDYTPSLEAAERLTGFFVTSTDGMEDHIRQRYENSLIPGHWESLKALHLQNPAVERPSHPDDWPEPLRHCETPILFVEGEDDPLLETGWAAQMAELGATFSSAVLPGSHEPNLDHPAETAEVIRRFLAQHR
jgi:pimeloyl-ACP methyl ester carboxylesterase